MSDSFIFGAEDAKDSPEPGESWLIPVNYEDQRIARVTVKDVLEDGAYVQFDEDAKVGGRVVEVEFEEGDKEKFGLNAFKNGKPIGQ
ncbi:hypothetical protein [Natrinema hispanicum]|uniref:Uncharacterized protein n=1 Tax=Natrinema hispanicum TaxID=392421 RepID=A0A1G6YBQ1_9EURY|nr:hypothetical protein [Natrinema hispanicum]SDD87809.1 hypothetical protein SAMN05192552_10636 [Natrinema hispanicum]